MPAALRRPRWLAGDLGDLWRVSSGPARAALVLAEERARELRHTFLGTEHVLLGLLGAEEGLGAALLRGGRPPSPGHPRGLRGLGLDPAAVRARMEQLVGHGPAPSPAALPVTPRTRRVLDLTAEEARRRDNPHVGTEHLLLGLLREGEGMGARVLRDFGADLPNVLGRLDEFGEKDAPSIDARQGDGPDAHIAPRWGRVWCDGCGSVQPLVVDHVTHHDGTPGHLDLVCGSCRLVVTTLHPAAEQG